MTPELPAQRARGGRTIDHTRDAAVRAAALEGLAEVGYDRPAVPIPDTGHLADDLEALAALMDAPGSDPRTHQVMMGPWVHRKRDQIHRPALGPQSTTGAPVTLTSR